VQEHLQCYLQCLTADTKCNILNAIYSTLFCHIKDVFCQTDLQQLRDMCFAAASQKLWNSLPADLQQANINFQLFKRLLKIFLFGCWNCGALWLTDKAELREFSYLLTYQVDTLNHTRADARPTSSITLQRSALCCLLHRTSLTSLSSLPHQVNKRITKWLLSHIPISIWSIQTKHFDIDNNIDYRNSTGCKW